MPVANSEATENVDYFPAKKNPVKAALRIVQQFWDGQVKLKAFEPYTDIVEWFTFKYIDIIGNGTFGIVCRALDLSNNEIVAIKTVYQDEGHQNRELAIIKSLNNENIVKLKKYFYQKNEYGEEFLSLVLEYVPTSMDKLLREVERTSRSIPLEIIRFSMYQFIRALNYLHSIGICHRDIKPHNLLIDIDKRILKLCDFGCSKRLIEGEPNINYICARFYRAPEIVFGWTHYSCSIDMWSAGCVMAELFTGKPLFPGINSMDQLAKIIKILGAPTPSDLRAMGQTSGLNNKKPKQQQQSANASGIIGSSASNSHASINSINDEHHLNGNSMTNGKNNGNLNSNNNNGSSNNSNDGGGCITLKEFIRAHNRDASEQSLDLIDKLLRYDPSMRITAKEALEHVFFDPIKKMISSNSHGSGNDESLADFNVYRATFQPS